MPSIRSLREKRQGLIDKAETAFEVKGRKYVKVGFSEAVVPLEFVLKWTKQVEIDIGLALGRNMEDPRYEN